MKIEKKMHTRNILIRISAWFCDTLARITGGKMDLHYPARTTTMGRTMYTGTEWEQKSESQRILETNHEAEHVRQWLTWWMLYPVSYLLNIWTALLPVAVGILGWHWLIGIGAAVLGALLPAGLSLRAYWEYKAFGQTLQTMRAFKVDQFFYRSDLLNRYTELLTGKPYYYAGYFLRPIIRRTLKSFLDRNKIGTV